jgi:hypothetical protein
MTMLFGAPAGWLLDVWLALPPYLGSVVAGAVGVFLGRLSVDVGRWRRQGRWPW